MPDLDFNIPRLRPGDRAFVEDDDRRHNAVLGWAHGDWGLYASGYQWVADAAVERLEREPLDLDFAVYPIAFLYRQYIELQLKQLWMECRRYRDGSPACPIHHRLELLWRDCRPVLDELEPHSSDEHDTAERVILEFAEVDPGSFAFRYPTDTEGRKSLPPELRQLSPRKMREVVAGLGVFLDGAITMVYELVSWDTEVW